jgi:hypothetical protein
VTARLLFDSTGFVCVLGCLGFEGVGLVCFALLLGFLTFASVSVRCVFRLG